MIKLLIIGLSRLRSEEKGIALTEYLILLGLLTAGVILAVLGIGGDLAGFWEEWDTWFDSAELGAPSGS